MKQGLILTACVVLALLSAACSTAPETANTAALKPADSSTADSTVGIKGGEACQRAGGEWTRGGVLGLYGCLLPARDGGKVCRDSQECQYNCNAAPGTTPAPGQAATGQCQANNSYGGCRIEIIKGIAQPRYCVKI
ncbi:MAG: hypothetical protein R3E95_06455 [Thiolinea sp.]